MKPERDESHGDKKTARLQTGSLPMIDIDNGDGLLDILLNVDGSCHFKL